MSKKIGVETGGSNVQFAINPKNGRMVIIEIEKKIKNGNSKKLLKDCHIKSMGFSDEKIAELTKKKS